MNDSSRSHSADQHSGDRVPGGAAPTRPGHRTARATPLGLLDDLDAIVWEMDPHSGRFTFVSAGAERILGYPIATWIDDPGFWSAHVHAEDRERAAGFHRACATGGREHELEYRMIAADGTVVWLHDVVHVVGNPAGHASELHGVMVDISRHKHLEAALRASEERLARFAEASLDGVILHEGGTILDINTAGAAMFGYEPAELIGRSAGDVTAPEDRARLAAHIAADAETPLEGHALAKDGHTFPVQVRGRRVTIGGRRARLVVVRDLSEQQRAEQALRDIELQFRQSQKLEAVGRLAGGIAHDFNNLLTVITAFTEMVAKKTAPVDPRRADLEQVLHAAHQAADLTRQLLAFSRKQVLRPEELDVTSVVADVEKMLSRLIGEDVHLVTRLGAPAYVYADRSQLEQVLMNLVINARDAMPDGGVVTISVDTVEVDAGFARRQLGMDATPGRYVRLEVADTGIGMTEAVASRAFEPFFTTKPLGAGTGLGLSTVYGIVAQSGGYVRVRSAPGHGTTFSVYFADAGTAVREEAPASRLAPRGTETILLAEDEDSVRIVTQRILESQGYTVVAARDGQEAVEIAARRPDIALLLTDVVMPRLNGHETAARVREARPGVRVLFMSGYPGDPILRRVVEHLGPRLIQKPFTIETLTTRVRATLDEPMQSDPGTMPPGSERHGTQ